MKKWLFLLVLSPWVLSAQYDFDSRYFTINSESLPEIEELTSSSFTLDKAPLLPTKLKTFQMNAENYRQPVDMATVVNENQRYVQRKVDVLPMQLKVLGIKTGSRIYQADGSSGVKNIVYKEVRGLDILDPCPPFGICARCAPYRVGRGY